MAKDNKVQEKPCNYCISIYNSTPASPRRKYKYCPMCGVGLDFNMTLPVDRLRRDRDGKERKNF